MAIRPTLAGLGIFYSPTLPHTLPRGSFISLYAGEYLTTPQARQRWNHAKSDFAARYPTQGNYILSLRLPGEVIHIDPRHIGNVGRFLNHSCVPNCIVEVVKWGATAPARAGIFVSGDVRFARKLICIRLRGM
jgi:histone-lysine N-methyltransferase SETMAR